MVLLPTIVWNKLRQSGKIGYENILTKDQKLPTFKSIIDYDVKFVKKALSEKPTQTSTDIRRLLAEKGTHVSSSTVHKVIEAAGFTATSPRYGQMVRDVNKVKRVAFAKENIANNDNFDNIIFTDECSVQLHDNKIVIYRERDSVAPVLPKPKHILKVHVWAGISRRGTTWEPVSVILSSSFNFFSSWICRATFCVCFFFFSLFFCLLFD